MNLAKVFETAEAVLKIGSSLKPNHHREVLIAQIREMLCTKNLKKNLADFCTLQLEFKCQVHQ